jgi:hypothetical protein
MGELIRSYISPKRHDLMSSASIENNISDEAIIEKR